MEWLDFVGIAKLAELQAGALSYGQRKLLELAYVLVADPDVILLDEPAGGVNLTLINEIAEKIRDAQRGGQDLPDRRAQHGVRDEPLCTVTVMHQGRDLVSGRPARSGTIPLVLDAYLGGGDEDDERPRGVRQWLTRRYLSFEGVVAGYGGGDVLKGVEFDVPRVASPASSVRTVQASPRSSRPSADWSSPAWARSGSRAAPGRPESERDPAPRRRAGPPEPQPLSRDDGARERRARRLPRQGQEGDRRAHGHVREIFPSSRNGRRTRPAASPAASSASSSSRDVSCSSRSWSCSTSRRWVSTRRPCARCSRPSDDEQAGRTVLLVEQNARQALKMSHFGVVLGEREGAASSGRAPRCLNNPEIGALYLGGSIEETTQDRGGIRRARG